MDESGYLSNPFRHGTGRQGDDLLMGRLGSELALIYHDTLQAALPPRLQSIVDRLEEAIADQSSAERDRRAQSELRSGR